MPRASKTGVRGLYRDDDGRYRIDLRWNDVATGELRRHKERLAEGVTAVAAKRRALEVLNAAMGGTYVSPDDAARNAREDTAGRLGAAFDRYMEHNRSRGLRSADDRKAHRDRFVEVLGADRRLATLVALDVERVRKVLRDEHKLGPATCNRYLATFKHFCRWAEDNDGTMPPEVAARLRKVKPMREPPGRVRYVKADEEKILATLDGWLRPIVLAGRCSGMRLGEITSLRWRQIDRADASIELPRTKSGRRRVVPITPALASVLAMVPPGKGDAHVFPIPAAEIMRKRSSSDDTWRRDRASGAFGEWTRAAGLSDFHFHDCRHDFATRVRRSGEGLDVVADLLGHASLQMSARYAHLDDEAKRRAAAKVTLPVVPPEASELARAANDDGAPGVAPDASRFAPALPPGLRLLASPRADRPGLQMGHDRLELSANGLRDADRDPTDPAEK